MHQCLAESRIRRVAAFRWITVQRWFISGLSQHRIPWAHQTTKCDFKKTSLVQSPPDCVTGCSRKCWERIHIGSLRGYIPKEADENAGPYIICFKNIKSSTYLQLLPGLSGSDRAVIIFLHTYKASRRGRPIWAVR